MRTTRARTYPTSEERVFVPLSRQCEIKYSPDERNRLGNCAFVNSIDGSIVKDFNAERNRRDGIHCRKNPFEYKNVENFISALSGRRARV